MPSEVLAGKAYTPQHEWVSVDKEGIATVGITEYAQKALGDVVYVEIVDVGTTVEKGENLGAVESVKSASDIYAPIGGSIVEMNPVLADKPGQINQGAETTGKHAPYDACLHGLGWLCKMTATNVSDVNELLSAEEYKKHCEK